MVVVEGGQHDHRHIGLLTAQVFDQVQAVGTVQLEAGESQIRRLRLGDSQRLRSIAGLPTHGEIRLGVDQGGERLSHQRVLIYEQHARDF
jgi:hypothetical protein